MHDEHAGTRTGRRRGIYILPNLITISSLMCGFYAAISAVGGNFEHAAVAIIICAALDALDGNIARLTNTASRFGAELDSLTDAIVFGCVPALIAYQWSLHSLAQTGWLWGKLGWLIAFVYTAATVLRLARFNSQAASVNKQFFRGMPCPAAAVLVASLVWSWESMGYAGAQLTWLVMTLMVLAGAAMVSNFSYFALKGFQWKSRVSFVVLLLFIAGLIIVAIDFPKFMFFLTLLYLFSGPALYLARIARRAAARPRGARQRR